MCNFWAWYPGNAELTKNPLLSSAMLLHAEEIKNIDRATLPLYEGNDRIIQYYPTPSTNSHDTKNNDSRTSKLPFVKLNCSIVKSALARRCDRE
ncbi:MAG: hypothetical protein P2A85_11490 [Microcoleus anatoxicus]|uniref:hypothetical protein n=1 Tax=Microcoleus anatoxicus TaxID=2705319 RepID=UPI00366E5FC4